MGAASWHVSGLIERLESDPWRTSDPFSDDIIQCHATLFDAGSSRAEKIAALDGWLAAKNQPCFFGRMEAQKNRLEFCLLSESDFARSDQEIRAKIP